MRIAIGNDHAGYSLKLEVVEHLRAMGHEVDDLGHHGADRADYPTYGRAVAEAVASGLAPRGIVICGSGVGISIAANKVLGIRCVCCSEPYSARLSRQHNNSNVLALGARVVGTGLAMMIIDTWLEADFEEGGRHADRLALISDIERERSPL
ncbi:ribose 5-phosphate isomerase B [Tessaracoccus sp. Z1128]